MITLCMAVMGGVYMTSWKKLSVNLLFMKEMSKILMRNYGSPVRFAINDSGKSASISYVRNGMNYIVNVPYHRNKVGVMSGIKAYLIRRYLEEEEAIEITQQSGVPYLVSAEMLGGEKILLKYREGEVKEFIGNEIPTI